MPSFARFLRQYVRPAPGRVSSRDVHYHRGEEALEATLYYPAGRNRDLPGWVVLHGLTYAGRRHPSLVRFVEAVAASGTAVLVPEIPEWRDLHVRPRVTIPTIRAAVLALDERPEVRRGNLGLFGFSFGATQALVAAADPRIEDHLTAIAAWGGYRDLVRLFRFGLTGEHDLDGQEHHIEADPYGRWIMGANYLCAVPGHETYDDVAAALFSLARAAGAERVFAGDPVHDPLKRRLRAALPTDSQQVFDLFAPPAGRQPADMERARGLAEDLARAAARVEPLMDPTPALQRVRVRTLLAHGKDDRLIPFTETLRLARDLPPDRLVSCAITQLFEHSGRANRSLGPVGIVQEGARFAAVLRRILGLV